MCALTKLDERPVQRRKQVITITCFFLSLFLRRSDDNIQKRKKDFIHHRSSCMKFFLIESKEREENKKGGGESRLWTILYKWKLALWPNFSSVVILMKKKNICTRFHSVPHTFLWVIGIRFCQHNIEQKAYLFFFMAATLN